MGAVFKKKKNKVSTLITNMVKQKIYFSLTALSRTVRGCLFFQVKRGRTVTIVFSNRDSLNMVF